MKTVATADQGTAELARAIEAFRARAEGTGLLDRKRRAHLRQQFEEAVRSRVMAHVWSTVVPGPEVEATLDRLARRETDPFTAAAAVCRRMGL